MLRFQRYGSAIAHFSVLVFGTAACASPPSAIGTGGTSSSAGSAGMAGNTSVGGSAGTSGASGGSMGGGAGTNGENGGSGGGAGNGSLGGSAGANAGSAGSAGAGGSSAEAGSSGVGGSGGTGNPDLDDLLLEGVGDIERPPPYEYGPYAQRRDDVPHGTVHEFTYEEDTFYPEAGPRGIKVFEPAQYEEGEEVFEAPKKPEPPVKKVQELTWCEFFRKKCGEVLYYPVGMVKDRYRVLTATYYDQTPKEFEEKITQLQP